MIGIAHFRSAIGVILVFHPADRKSFDDVTQWFNDIHRLCDPNAVAPIGSKLDFRTSRSITAAEAETFAIESMQT